MNAIKLNFWPLRLIYIKHNGSNKVLKRECLPDDSTRSVRLEVAHIGVVAAELDM